MGGAWENLLREELHQRFDYVLMSETLYNEAYYSSLLLLVKHCLKPSACCLVGTKTFYYGLGGGYHSLMNYLQTTRDLSFKCEILHRINNGLSIERLVLKLDATEPNAPDLTSNAAEDNDVDFEL